LLDGSNRMLFKLNVANVGLDVVKIMIFAVKD